jgi:hypothetical protein
VECPRGPLIRSLATKGGHGGWPRRVATEDGHGGWPRRVATEGGHGGWPQRATEFNYHLSSAAPRNPFLPSCIVENNDKDNKTMTKQKHVEIRPVQ